MIMGWYNDELYHHGIRGQKWGVRRFQKSDGTLTSAGKKRYDSDGEDGNKTSYGKSVAKAMTEAANNGDYDKSWQIAMEAAKSGKLRKLDSLLDDKKLGSSVRGALKQTKALIEQQKELHNKVNEAYDKLENGGSAAEYNKAVKNIQANEDTIQRTFENSLKKAGYYYDGFTYDSKGNLAVRASKYNMDEIFESHGQPYDEVHLIISTNGDLSLDDDY